MNKSGVIFEECKQRLTCRLKLYGKETCVEYVTFQASVYQTPAKLLQVVVVQFPETKGKKPLPVTLYSTDSEMSPDKVIEAYCRRWAIEETFQDAKGHLGMDESQSGGADGADDPLSSCNFVDVGRPCGPWKSGG